ncbi:MAG: amino acid ABC transporter substrate-binding protein [Actinobacteria bacterium]|nr:amino acid ABC transporter substrate-binding protein [Actinomycetota bacterium]
MATTALRIGALAPLSRPGWIEAGEHLLAGIELAVLDVNASGGLDGRPIELLVRDTAADPAKAAGFVEELAGIGVAGLVGEYHSVAARAAASSAAALGLPFLCSSAVLDAPTEEPTDWVARLAPVQSRGWRGYGDFLCAAGHTRVAVAVEPSPYWAAGTTILREHLSARGGTVLELDARPLDLAGIHDALLEETATVLLLLVGNPEPAVSIVRSLRADRRLHDVLIGAPAGQPELPAWTAALGAAGAAIPFLRYRPQRLTPLGGRVEVALRERLGTAPSFVALEGYDSTVVLAEFLRSQSADPVDPGQGWARLRVEGCRAEISFSRTPGVSVWQWVWPPIHVVDRDPADPDRFRVLYSP